MSTRLGTAQDTFQIANDTTSDLISPPLGAKREHVKTSQVDAVIMHITIQIEFPMSAVQQPSVSGIISAAPARNCLQ